MPNDYLVVLMPVFNDWAACDQLLLAVDDVLAGAGLSAAIVLVDDGSTVPMSRHFGEHDYRALSRVDVLRLRRNLGHQRAICVGLCYLDGQGSSVCEAVVLMDSDGEDDARDIPRLLEKHRQEGGQKIVVAVHGVRGTYHTTTDMGEKEEPREGRQGPDGRSEGGVPPDR